MMGSGLPGGADLIAMSAKINSTFTRARIRAMAKESGLPVKTVRAALLSGARQVKEACEAARQRKGH